MEAKTWQETVIEEERLIRIYEQNNPADDHPVGCNNIAKAQAEITWKARELEIIAARREVVEWVELHGLLVSLPEGTSESLREFSLNKRSWQDKLKEWGIHE